MAKIDYLNEAEKQHKQTLDDLQLQRANEIARFKEQKETADKEIKELQSQILEVLSKDQGTLEYYSSLRHQIASTT